MNLQRRLIPSTSMLMAFDAAARAGSFTVAAYELNLTQGAISRQVNALEHQLDVALFERVRRSVHLTEVGRLYAKDVHNALQLIRSASLNAIENPLNGTLNLAILPTFGTRWLMPRFPDFLKRNPTVTVNFVTRLSPFDFHSGDLHAAIHYGSDDWPNTTSTFLMDEVAIPVCAPSFLSKNTLCEPRELTKLPLLHLATRSQAWGDWFKLHEIEAPKAQGMLFEQFSIIAKAAAAGIGVALLPKFLIQGELDRGELTPILNLPIKSGFGYYLVTPIDKKKYAPVVVFTEWLLKMSLEQVG